MKSSFLSLTAHDFVKGLVLVILTSIIKTIVPILYSGSLPTLQQLHSAAILGLYVGGAYLLKNFLTNSSDQMLKTEASIPQRVQPPPNNTPMVEKTLITEADTAHFVDKLGPNGLERIPESSTPSNAAPLTQTAEQKPA